MRESVRVDLTEYLPALLERMENPVRQSKVPDEEPDLTFVDWFLMVFAAICWFGLLVTLAILKFIQLELI